MESGNRINLREQIYFLEIRRNDNKIILTNKKSWNERIFIFEIKIFCGRNPASFLNLKSLIFLEKSEMNFGMRIILK